MTATSRLQLLKRVTMMAAATVAAFIGLATFWGMACSPFSIFGNCMPWVHDLPLATRSLLFGGPESHDSTRRFVGYDRFTADELNRVYPGSQREAITGPIRFLPADIPSTGPSEVSVNPIDDYTWGAASAMPQGPCFLILWSADRSNPEFGGATFGVLPAGTSCVGAKAIPENVPLKDWMHVRVRQPALIDEGATFLYVGLTLVIVSHVIALRRQRPLLSVRVVRWALFSLGIVAMVMGMLPLLVGLG